MEPPLNFRNFLVVYQFIMSLNHQRIPLSSVRSELWPRCHGKRSGRLVKAREVKQTIRPVRPRRFKRDIRSWPYQQRSRIPSNCLSISSVPRSDTPNERQGKQFVPSLFLSSAMSLILKIDEVSYVLRNAN